ncbi:MAG: ribonuclease III [Clostridia bacterium]|nr:ribonuclease III [Clostridia bacterium]
MNEREFPYAEIEKKIGYRFRDRKLLKQAFTHSTYAHAFGGEDNERMEYLGDSVLQLVVTEWQYERNMQAQEGQLTRERQKYVCEEALDDAVRAAGLEEYLLVVGSSANVGKKTVSSLFETVVAALYLDGGYEVAKTFILAFGGLERELHSANYKGAVQEYLQQRGIEPPVYRTEKTGKDNAPTFYTTVSAMGVTARGEGGSKKQAEQNAARALLDQWKKIKDIEISKGVHFESERNTTPRI